jgi:O-antigen/teichoic acid export membrane protein
MPNSIALWVSRTFDRIIVSFFCGVAANGVYSTGVQVSFVLYFVQDSLSQALGPLQIQAFIEDKKTAMRRLKSLGEVLIILMTVASLLWICICPELMYLLLDSRYLPSLPLVASLSCLYVFQAQYRLYSDVLSYHNKNKYIMYAAIAQAVLSLALNLTLIPILGYEVAGFVSLISVILYMIIIVWSAGKFETIELNKPIFIKYLILLFSLLTAVTIFPNIDMITRYIIAALVILISFKDIRTSFRLLD